MDETTYIPTYEGSSNGWLVSSSRFETSADFITGYATPRERTVRTVEFSTFAEAVDAIRADTYLEDRTSSWEAR